MLDDLKEESIVNKVGGRFKLSTLIQKRMVALNTGARPLVDTRTQDRLQIVLQEIVQDKIFLDSTGTVQTRAPSAGDAARRHMMPDISDAGAMDDCPPARLAESRRRRRTESCASERAPPPSPYVIIKVG